jgi:hypothetical protein
MPYTTDAKSIIDLAAVALDDTARVNWTETELLWWLRLSQTEMVNLAPFTNIKNIITKLVPGVLLVDIPYNYGTGNRVGGAIIRVPKELMDKRIPGWTTATASPIIKRYVYNQKDPMVYYVYPPQPTLSTYVELAYAAVPGWVANINPGTKITVDDQYQNVLLNLILAKAFAKDSEYGNNIAKAREYRALAEQELGLGNNSAEQSQNPQQNNAEG